MGKVVHPVERDVDERVENKEYERDGGEISQRLVSPVPLMRQFRLGNGRNGAVRFPQIEGCQTAAHGLKHQ